MNFSSGSVPRQQEKPTLLSKRVLRTFRLNKTENMKLKERLRHLDHSHIQQNVLHTDDVRDLKRTMNRINTVKEKMEVSVQRRKFLAEHGVTIKQKDIDINDFVNSLDEVIFDDKESQLQRKRMSKSPIFFDSKQASATASSSSSEVSSSSLRLSIESLLNKGKDQSPIRAASALPKRQPVETATGLSDEETSVQLLGRPYSAPVPRERKSYIFRDITPPLKGRRIDEVYKQKVKEEKVFEKMKEREQFQKRTSLAKLKKDQRKRLETSNGSCHMTEGKDLQVYRSKSKEEIVSDKEDNIVVYREDHSCHISQSSNETTDVHKVSYDSDANEESPATDHEIEDAFQKLMLRSVNQKRPKSFSLLNVSDLDNVFEEKVLLPSSSLKIAKSNEDVTQRPKSRAKVAWVDICTGKETLDYSQGAQSQCYSKGHSDACGEELITPRDKWQHIIKRVSEGSIDNQLDKWHDIVQKVSQDLKMQKQKLDLLERRSQTLRRRAKTLDTIHDVRPNKSVAKGYATMQITIGKQTVSVYVSRFKTDTVCTEQTESRANARSSFAVEEVRTKRVERDKK